MRADPKPDAVAARELTQEAQGRDLDALRVTELQGRLMGFAPVRVPLRVGVTAAGLPELVHVDTGQSFGACASEELARRIVNFFA